MKHSTDTDAEIRDAIEYNGSDEIIAGEIVLGLTNGQARLYTQDAVGNVVSMGSAGNFYNPMTEDGDLITTFSDTAARLPIGGYEQLLRVGSSFLPEWYTPTFISDLVEDVTPQLGGVLDVQSHAIVSTSSNDITLAPTNDRSVLIRANLEDAKIRLNSFGNSYGVYLKAPSNDTSPEYTFTFPGSSGADGQVLSTDGSGVTSWVNSGLEDVTLTSLEVGQILKYDGDEWVNVADAGGDLSLASIGDLGDVNTSGLTDGNLLSYDSTAEKWRPVSPSGTGLTSTLIGDLSNVDNTSTSLTAGDLLEYNGTSWVNTQSRANAFRTYSTARSANASQTFGIQNASCSGVLVSMTSTADVWVTLYTDTSSRTADAARLFSKDPSLSSGVIVDAYLTADTELLLTPAIPYFSLSNSSTILVRARDQDGATLVPAFVFTLKMMAN